MLAAALCVLLTTALPDETVANGFPVLAADVEAFYIARAKAGGKLEYPRFATKSELVQGQVGVMKGDLGPDGTLPSSRLVIRQVIDGDNAIADLVCDYNETQFRDGGGVAIPFSEPKRKTVTVLLSGFDLSAVADGDDFRVMDALIVDGTHRYATVAGGTNTIPVVRSTKLPPPPKHPAQLGIGVRSWKDATGNFSIDAAYVGYDKGTVELVKRSGETIKVPIAKLGRDEQEYVREQIKAAKAKEVTRP